MSCLMHLNISDIFLYQLISFLSPDEDLISSKKENVVI